MTRQRNADGQTLVEFALVITLFLVLMMAVFDFGRGIYQYNGVSQAAREIARATSVHPCAGSPCTLGMSTQTQQVIATQKQLIPNLGNPTFVCVDVDGAAVHSNSTCRVGDHVRVVVAAPYSPLTPLLGLAGTWDLQSSSTVAIQN